jgi:hypothetical protein
MFDENVINKLKERYQDFHPLMFKRSVEKAKTLGELFDILEDIPDKYPLKWCEEKRKWISCKDYFKVENFLKLNTGIFDE